MSVELIVFVIVAFIPVTIAFCCLCGLIAGTLEAGRGIDEDRGTGD